MIRKHLVSLSRALAALACNDTTVAPDARVPGIQAMSFANSEWSTPVHVDAPVNSAASEQSPALSPDGLSLYFGSNRAGGLGGLDIWVSRRASLDSPWETPINLGPSVNSPSDENAASFSADGHLL